MRKKFKKSRIIVIILILIVAVELVFLLTKPLQKSAETEAQSIVSQCAKTKNWYECFGSALARLNEKRDFGFSMSVFNEIQMADPKARDCHIMAHYLMLSEVKKNPSRWADLMKKIDPNACTYGFIHGVIEGRERYLGGNELDPQSVNRICELIFKKNSGYGVDQACAHIVGHIILAEQRGDIDKSVSICNGVDNKLRDPCYSGIFMESFTRDNLVAHGIGQHIPWNEETIKNQENICRKYPEEAAHGCWQEITHMYMSSSKNNPRMLWELCNHAPNDNDVLYCYMHGVGSQIKAMMKDEYKKVACEPFLKSDSKMKFCINYITLAFITESIKFFPDVLAFCNNDIPEKYKKECYKNIQQALSKYASVSVQNDLCTSAPADFRSYCPGRQ